MLNSHFSHHLGCVAATFEWNLTLHVKLMNPPLLIYDGFKNDHGGTLEIQLREDISVDFSQEMSVLVAVTQPESFPPDFR